MFPRSSWIWLCIFRRSMSHSLNFSSWVLKSALRRSHSALECCSRSAFSFSKRFTSSLRPSTWPAFSARPASLSAFPEVDLSLFSSSSISPLSFSSSSSRSFISCSWSWMSPSSSSILPLSSAERSSTALVSTSMSPTNLSRMACIWPVVAMISWRICSSLISALARRLRSTVRASLTCEKRLRASSYSAVFFSRSSLHLATISLSISTSLSAAAPLTRCSFIDLRSASFSFSNLDDRSFAPRSASRISDSRCSEARCSSWKLVSAMARCCLSSCSSSWWCSSMSSHARWNLTRSVFIVPRPS
mmetsp:Transcript_7207/g.10695  ORF Transcript_7207/g.10695 Transcript_7207/m.10695 type:complete len:303 (-) Transcript_7207:135-1043(-)